MERPLLIYILIAVGILLAAILRAYLKKRSRLEGFFRFTHWVEVGFIAVLLFALIFFGCLQIVLRNFFHTGLIWADPLMRHIVLWLGCMGAVLATSRMRHISIDIFTRFLPKAALRVRNKIIFFATALAASVLGFAALKLVIDERSFGEKAFLGVGIWILMAVLPAAFFLIAYRSLLNMMVPPDIKPVEWDEFTGGSDGSGGTDASGGDDGPRGGGGSVGENGSTAEDRPDGAGDAGGPGGSGGLGDAADSIYGDDVSDGDDPADEERG